MSQEPGAALPDERLLSRALTGGAVAVTLADARRPGRPLIWVNAAFTQLTGYRAEEMLGISCRVLQGPATDSAAVQRIREALDAGRGIDELLLNYRKDGSPFWNRVVITPLFDEAGTLTHFVGAQSDLTDQVATARAKDAALGVARDATARLDLLAAVSDELARRLDYDAAVDALAETAVPALADWGFAAVVDERGRFTRLALATADDDHAAEVALLGSGTLEWLQRSPRIKAALGSTGDEMPVPLRIEVDAVAGRTPEAQMAVLRRLGLGSSLVVPLRARGRVLGVLALVTSDPDGFDREAVITAAHLGRRAGLALDNARLFIAQRDAAVTLQRRLLPQIEDVPGLDLAAAYLPSSRLAEVGGDWYDVLPLADGSVAMAVGDVVGHDLNAAASMGQLASLLRSHAWGGDPPAQVLGRLDQLVVGLGMADIATCVDLRWMPSADGGARVTYSRAGHPPPLVRLPGGRVIDLDGAGGTPVGLVWEGSQARFDAVVDLPAGSVLVVYTDGLVERRDRGLREGIELLRRELSAVPEGSDAAGVRDRLVERLAAGSQDDDVCLLVVRPT